MYNPFPYDDPRAVNRPELKEKTVKDITTGTLKSAARLAENLVSRLEQNPGKNITVAFDGYTTADWSRMVNLLSQQLKMRGVEMEAVDFYDVYKSEEEINAIIHPYLEWDRKIDPTLLYGRIYHGGYQSFFDSEKLSSFEKEMWKVKGAEANGKGKVVLVYGYGCLVKELRPLFDVKCYFDVTPKESILRIRRGQFANYGDKVARPANQVIRRGYYVDFEMAVHLRGELLKGDLLDYYLPSDDPDKNQLIPMKTVSEIMDTLATYPFRCKPVYLEGVWGGTYVKKLRNLPDTMRNCAWVFDLIPMEVSVVVDAGGEKVEFPFFSFVQKEGEAIMGDKCVKKFHGYFPIRFNYDDSYHSNGNMSIQVHSGAQYNHDRYDELGRQDESYYVVVAGQGAKTFVGFRDDADTDQLVQAGGLYEVREL